MPDNRDEIRWQAIDNIVSNVCIALIIVGVVFSLAYCTAKCETALEMRRAKEAEYKETNR